MEHWNTDGTLVEHQNIGGTIRIPQNNWNTMEHWNIRRAAEQQNNKTTAKNINTE